MVNHEALLFQGGRIWEESFVTGSRHAGHYDSLSHFGWFLLKNYWLRRGSIRIPSGLWILDNYSPGNYHHWMIDVLPRLLQAEQTFPEENVLLLPRYYNQQAYIHFTLPAFPQVAHISWISPRHKVKVNDLKFIPRQTKHLPTLIREVANRVSRLAGAPSTASRVYFSRADATRRRASNEEAVTRALREMGFSIVHIDTASPWEQVRAASGADVIVGVHGAALTNIMFMQPGGHLLELRHGHDEVFFDAYRPIAHDLGIEYHKQVCELLHPASGLSINNVDLVVDVDELCERLHAIG